MVRFQCNVLSSSKLRFSFIFPHDIPLLQNTDTGWDLSKWQALIENRQFLSWLVQPPEDADKKKSRMIRLDEIDKLEEVWKKRPEATLKDIQAGGGSGLAALGLGELGEPETRPVSLHYEDAYQYQHTFAPLVKMESDYDKQMKESQSQDGVTVRWDIA